MPHPYSEDLRLRMVNAVENGKTIREVATLFQVSSSFVSQVNQCWQRTGHVHPKRIGGYRRAVLEPYEQALQAQLANDHGLRISILAIDKCVRQKLGYRYKKKPCSPVSGNVTMWQRPRNTGKPGSKPARYRSSCFRMKPAPQPI